METEIDGFLPTKVVAVCKGKRHTHKGHYFYYENDKFSKSISKCCSSIVVKIEGEDKYLKFSSITEAAKFLKVKRDRVVYILRYKKPKNEGKVKIKRPFMAWYEEDFPLKINDL